MFMIKCFKNKSRPHPILDFPDYFPEDILIQIFCRLPADHLQLLKTLCRRWKYIISSPYFVKLHLNFTIDSHNNSSTSICMFSCIRPSRHELGIYDSGLGWLVRRKKMVRTIVLSEFLNYPSTVPYIRYRLLGCCDGLLMFDTLNNGSLRITKRILILNPITRETREIAYPGMHVGYVCAIFFNRFQQQHMLLHVCNCKSNLSLGMYHTFSFTDSNWRRIETTTTPSSSQGHASSVPPCTHVSPPVIVVDVLHWIVDEGCRIMAFKIETREIQYFPHPMAATFTGKRDRQMDHNMNDSNVMRKCDACRFKFLDYFDDRLQLIEKNGKLCLCRIVKKRCVMNLWMLDSYGDWSSWVLRFKIELPHSRSLARCDSSDIWGSTILSFRDKDVIAIKWQPGKTFFYHLITKESTWIRDGNMFGRHRFIAFNKTLLSPNIIAYQSTLKC